MAIIVQVEAVNCGSSNACDADNFCPIAAPDEMVGPFVMAGVEEWLLRFGFVIGACGEVVAAAIAAGTSKRKVFCVITAAERLGQEMIEGE